MPEASAIRGFIIFAGIANNGFKQLSDVSLVPYFLLKKILALFAAFSLILL
jgi:hypothetical protein